MNKYWLIYKFNIDILAHACTKQILKDHEKHIDYDIKAISIFISWITIYLYYKGANLSREEINQKAKTSFSSILQTPDIIHMVGLKRNHQEYEECKKVLMGVWGNIDNLNQREASTLKTIIILCKSLPVDEAREASWEKLVKIIKDEAQRKALLDLISTYGKLSFISC